MYYRFYDMASGGSEKTEHSTIWIEAKDEASACDIFESTFNRNPNNITCDCCGEDFSISEYEELETDEGDFVLKDTK